MTTGREATQVECIRCRKRQTHRVCAECFEYGVRPKETTPCRCVEVEGYGLDRTACRADQHCDEAGRDTTTSTTPERGSHDDHR